MLAPHVVADGAKSVALAPLIAGEEIVISAPLLFVMVMDLAVLVVEIA
jgi:hypothetical protein